MSSGKDKYNVKQKVTQNFYNTLISVSKEANQIVQPNSISKGFSNRDITILSMNKTQKYLRY